MMKWKNLVTKEKKLEWHLKKLIKKYQTSQLRIKRIQMLYIRVEHLHLVIYYQNLLIHPLFLRILITKVFSILNLNFFFFKIIINFVLTVCDSQLIDLEVSNSIQIRGTIN